jgi:O-antigen/teichoic acid export membrane protein
VAFGATVYIARTLGAAGYGIVGVAAAVLLYFYYIADCGVEVLGVREIAADAGRVHGVAPAVLGVRLLVGAGLAGLLAIVGLLVLPQPDGAVLACYGLTLLAVGGNTRWVHLGLEQTRWAATARALGEATMLLLVLLLVHGTSDVARVPLAQFVGDALAALALAFWLGSRTRPIRVEWNWSVARPVLVAGWPLAANAILGLMVFNSDLIFLRIFHTPATVGQYAAAYTLISFLLNLGTTYGQSLLPTLTRQLGTGQERSLYDMAMAQVFAAGLPIAAGGALTAPLIIPLVFGPGYEPGVLALEILLWSIPIAFFRNVPQTALIAVGRQDQVLRITFWAAVLNLALNLGLIPRYGIPGAAIATLATELIRTVATLASAGRVGFPLTDPRRFWRVAVAGGTMAAALVVLHPATLSFALGVGVATYSLALAAVGGIRFHSGPRVELRL